jgi:2-hydroxychromene-2-carboxylate isomerase
VAEIDYFIHPLSAEDWLAGTRLQEIAARHGAGLRYRPVNFPKLLERTGGQMPSAWPEARQDYRRLNLRRQARALGRTMAGDVWWAEANPIPACAAIIAAAEAGGRTGDLLRAILSALWEQNRNVSEDEVLRDCLSACGLAPDIADKGLLRAVDVLERNTNAAADLGIFDCPAYVVGQEVFIGTESLPLLDLALAGQR